MTQNPVWLITGCSTGFGRELAKEVLKKGFRAVITARNKNSVEDLVVGHEQNALALALDVTDPQAIHHAVEQAKAKFGAVDVLVNNAGYGYQSSVEEGEEQAIRDQFDANVFGLFAVTRAVLPLMREAGRGHIINVTSIGGLMGFASSGYYSATKHAVEGWSDSLSLEVSSLGIHVTCVEPGPFRTDWAGRSLKQTPSKIADYADTAGARMKTTSDNSGKQAGDPVRAAQAMIAITQVDKPPRHLVLGAIGHEAVTKKLKERLAEIEQWKQTALDTDYPS